MDNIIPQINSRQAVALAGRADREQAAMQRSGYVVMALSSLLHDTLDSSGEEGSVINDWHRGAILQALQTIGNDLCHRGEALEDLLAGEQGGAA